MNGCCPVLIFPFEQGPPLQKGAGLLPLAWNRHATLGERSNPGPPRTGGQLQMQLSGWPGPEGNTGQPGSLPHTNP